MNIKRSLLVLVLLGTGFTAPGQNMFFITFRGTSYQLDSSGNMVPVPMTEQSLVADAARAGGVDASTLALVYHASRSSFGDGSGDTIDIVDSRTGVPQSTVLGLYFGSDPTLNRTSITNAPGTEVRRIDYLYTRQNSHSMGTGFVTKRYVTDANGNQRATVDGGQCQWLVLPENGQSAKMCRATFTTTRPFKAQGQAKTAVPTSAPVAAHARRL